MARWAFLYLAAGALALVHEERSGGLYGLGPRRGDRLDENAVFPIRIGLQQQNLESGYDYLLEVSHPSSPKYGQHWTEDEVNAKFRPSDEAVETVKAWLESSGIPSDAIKTTKNRGWIALELPVRLAEELFETEFYEYYQGHDDTVRIGSDRYSLPDHVSPHVDFVVPGVELSPPLKRSRMERRDMAKRESMNGGPGHMGPPFGKPWWGPPFSPIPKPPFHLPPGVGGLPPDLQGCSVNITPPCIRALYNIPFPHDNIAGNDLGVFEEGDVYSQADLNLFYRHFAPYVPQGTHPTLNSIDGGEAPVPPGDPANTGESDIDLDLGFSLLYPQGIQLYQVAFPDSVNNASVQYQIDLTFLTPFFDAVDGSFCTNQDRAYFQCGGTQLTKVLTASYSSPELYNTLSSSTRQCNEVLKLGLQGHTILFSSGDYGVASHPETLDANGCIPVGESALSANFSFSGPVFSPQFPSNCPYILSVGGTQLNSNETVEDPESVMQVPGLSPYPNAYFSSSGGFANYFTVPDYQKSAVSTYFKYHDPGYPYYYFNGVDLFSNGKSSIGANGGIYNRNGRGFPDVSANGAKLLAYNDLQLYHFYGTSLSSPIFASVLTLINGRRSEAGKKPVGFVHPVLYEHPEIFHDITNGTNPGCGTEGFPAVTGWDPSTGLGTPNFPKMLALFLSLP